MKLPPKQTDGAIETKFNLGSALAPSLHMPHDNNILNRLQTGH